MSTAQELEQRVSLIASKMTLREPFIAAVFTKLDRTFPQDGTAAVNGRRVEFGVDFCAGLSDEKLMGLALHEAMHVVLMHMWRRDGRDPALWNIANDAIINRMLAVKGYDLPDGGVQFSWVTEEMSSEEVYRKLLENPPPQSMRRGKGQQGQGQGDDPSSGQNSQKSGGGGWDGTGDLEDAADQADQADMEATIMTAARMAKACGDTSALVQRVLGGELSPSVRWSDVLRHVMTSAARDDYSYRRFNRRLLPQGIYMPSLYSDAMGGLVIGVDTSGSVSAAELDQIAGEINAIVEDCRPEWIEVVYCDSRVLSTERFTQGDPVQLHPKGGGGTRFKPVFDHVERMGEKVAAMIYLTDLDGPLDLEAPDYPVIWGVTSPRSYDAEVPFGTVVPVVV